MMICDESGVPLLCPVCPDLNFFANEVVALQSRVGTEMPNACEKERDELISFSKLFIREEWPNGVDPNDVPDFMKWINVLTNYQPGRKKALYNIRKAATIYEVKGKDCVFNSKGFIKRENYPSYKAPRMINSPSDLSKVLIAPLCHAIDKATFKSKFFVKGSNPKTWPSRLEQVFGSKRVCATDFTACESHHKDHIVKIIKYWMMHMVRFIPGHKVAKDIIHTLMDQRNTCVFKNSIASVDQRLMSGAMWTSSANGMFNLLVNSYMAATSKLGPNSTIEERVNWARLKMCAVFEGDDGLIEDVGQTNEMMTRLGLKLKLERHIDYGTAGFCGIVCPRAETGVAKDPYEVMKSFFWLPPKYDSLKQSKRLGLLRAKAMSYKYVFGGNPIITQMCDWVLYETKSYTSNYDDVSDGWKTALDVQQERETREKKPIPMYSRLICEKKFGIDLNTQIKIEEILESAWGHKTVCIQSCLLQREFDRLHVARYCHEKLDVTPCEVGAAEQLKNVLENVPAGTGSARLIKKARRLKRQTIAM